MAPRFEVLFFSLPFNIITIVYPHFCLASMLSIINSAGRVFLRRSLKPSHGYGQVSLRKFSRSLVALQNTNPQKLREEWDTASFDVPSMTRLLDHDNHEKREKFRKILSEDPLMTPKYNISVDEERALALKRLKKLCDQGFISVLDFRHNPRWIFAAHELAAVVDGSMATKMTVQFNLFGGTVLKLGTARHHDKLLKVNLLHAYMFCQLQHLLAWTCHIP